MESVLLYDIALLPPDQQMILPATASWDYLSNAFWGEDGIGSWSLTLADAIPGNTTIWNNYSVLLNLGEMQLLNPGETILDHDVSARSLSLLNEGTDLIIPNNRSFSVEHDVLVDGGGLSLTAILASPAPWAAEWF
jgi:subtilisin-like proprotein convertase family protein